MPETMDGSESIAAAIAHEVNNLLTPVIGLADLLEHTEGDPSIRDQLIERAVDRCQRAVAICALLLDLTKEHAGEDARCDISALMATTSTTASSRAMEMGVRLECGFDEAGAVAVPPAVAEHVLLNLVLNAIDASQTDTSISLSAQYRPGTKWHRASWTISVEDEGKGLEHRSVASINDGGLPVGSTGIGLAVVRLLCQRWGGRLHVESELGVGTTFHVELPAA